MTERRYWDSDCFLGWLRDEEDKSGKCAAVLALVEEGKIELVTSALTLAEVLRIRGREPLSPGHRLDVEMLFARRNLSTMAVTRRIAEEARELVWEHGIHPKDAIHVATALAAEAPVLNTFDRKLIKKSETVGDPPLLIAEPEVLAPKLP